MTVTVRASRSRRESYCTEKKNLRVRERYGNADDRCIADLSHVLILSNKCLHNMEGAVTRTVTSDFIHTATILTTASGAIAEEDSGQPRQLHFLHFILGRLHNLLEGRPEVVAHMRSILVIYPPIGVHRAEAVFQPM